MGELLEAERLGEQRDAVVEHAIVDDGVASVAGGVKNPDPRPFFLNGISKLTSAHLRHNDIGEDQIDLGVPLQKKKCLHTACRLQHGVAEFVQTFGGHGADMFIVLHHQYSIVDASLRDRLGAGGGEAGIRLAT